VDAKTWAVARVLDDHMDKDGRCFVSYGTIALHARIGRTAAKDGVARLVGAGLLELRQRRLGPAASDSNLYRALGVGAVRPGGGGGALGTPGRCAPQSPHEVEPSGHSGPRGRAASHPQDGGNHECGICAYPGAVEAGGLCRRCREAWDSGDQAAIDARIRKGERSRD
jgi:hypothetical protein